MNQLPVNSLDALANAYAVCWSAQRPASDTVRPANRAELRGALEANEVFFSLMEVLPNTRAMESTSSPWGPGAEPSADGPAASF